jgi:hypothetical protein
MSTAKPRPDLLSPHAPESAEIIQITTGDLPSCHIYMEAQIFAPDSKRFLLHESATPHGGHKDDPNHQYRVCDIDDGCSLRPITDELGPTAPSISPDGKYVYYFVDETEIGGGKLTLKRVNIDGTDRQTLLVQDTPLGGSPSGATERYASRLYPLSTIRSDGKSLALSCFLGDGTNEGIDWGLMVYDLEALSVELILRGQSWCNIHPQYSRSSDPKHMRDILVQENHGNVIDANGEIIHLVGGVGADIHVIREDGTDFRDMPWGRDGNEACQGHQCWRGETDWAITSTGTKQPNEQQLIESKAVDHAGHIGTASPGGVRNDMSRSFDGPNFFHFGTDKLAKRFVTDTSKADQGGRVFVADMGAPSEAALSGWTCVANANSSWGKDSHLHPFLSPDGTKAFFNSDESGVLHAYMVSGV